MTRTGLAIVSAVLLIVACDAATSPPSTIHSPDSSVTNAGALAPFVEDEDAASGVIWPLKCQRTCKMGH